MFQPENSERDTSSIIASVFCECKGSCSASDAVHREKRKPDRGIMPSVGLCEFFRRSISGYPFCVVLPCFGAGCSVGLLPWGFETGL